MNTHLDWPGKSADLETGIKHPAVYHMLDVAAVADKLLRREGFDEPVHQALLLLAALHDLGKIGARFRAMIEEGETQGERHWEVSMAWFAHFDADVLGPLLGGTGTVRFALYAAAAGHHGKPPRDADGQAGRNRAIMVNQAGAEAARDARQVIDAFTALFPDASLDTMALTFKKAGGDWQRSAKTLSRWFSGLVSTADWIGSNTNWFYPTAAGPSVAAYWESAQARADTALGASGVTSASPSGRAAARLFDFTAFSPMQQAALDTPLPNGPTLAVIEDATGSGKTEAALMLAHRMMQAGRADGLFFALPTMATANAMFTRLEAMGAMFEGQPSLALAHGRALFHEGFRALVGRKTGEPDDISCADWFADGRRKALLAQIGVGTIDQALLGVLPTRYFALRLYALSRKIMLVDEVHDFDPYMQAELERLLTFHAMLGGSAILMTATLPKGMRARLVSAFQKGASRDTRPELTDAYPQLALIGASEECKKVAPVPATVRRVTVERLETVDAALDVLAQASAQGAASAFIRNSVDEAINAVHALRARGVDAMLHHARFALCDRLANEDRVLSTFGKQAPAEARRGKVIASTQVLESSLDLDFDVMVSDLAPIGALIQRAGRLWRHKRDRPVDGPRLHVLSPDPDTITDAHWSRDLLGRGWFVYPVTLQWCTAKALFTAGCINAPDGLRALIEAADGETAPDVPSVLDQAEEERLGEIGAKRTLAGHNLLEPDKDYMSDQNTWSDAVFPTRLGPEQVVLMLARRRNGALEPLAPIKDGDIARAWALSEVSLAKHRWEQTEGVDQSAPDIAAIRKDWKAWKEATHFVCPVEDEGIICDGLHYDAEYGLVLASPHTRG